MVQIWVGVRLSKASFIQQPCASPGFHLHRCLCWGFRCLLAHCQPRAELQTFVCRQHKWHTARPHIVAKFRSEKKTPKKRSFKLMHHHHLTLLITQWRRGVRCRMRKKRGCQIVAISNRGVECWGVMLLRAYQPCFHIISWTTVTHTVGLFHHHSSIWSTEQMLLCVGLVNIHDWVLVVVVVVLGVLSLLNVWANYSTNQLFKFCYKLTIHVINHIWVSQSLLIQIQLLSSDTIPSLVATDKRDGRNRCSFWCPCLEGSLGPIFIITSMFWKHCTVTFLDTSVAFSVYQVCACNQL